MPKQTHRGVASGDAPVITMATPKPEAAPVTDERLPLAALLVLALTGFVLLSTETMPAGLLPQVAAGMGTTEAGAGQLVSAYALGTVLLPLPAVAWTRGRRRKPVLLVGLMGFLVA